MFLTYAAEMVLCNSRIYPLYPQYRHGAQYVGPPQPYPVPPPTSGTFYSGPGPGEYPTPYGQYTHFSLHYKLCCIPQAECVSQPAGLVTHTYFYHV